MRPKPTSDAFSLRSKALEDAFFKERDRHLLEKMRRELESMEEGKALTHVSGIIHERVLHSLVEAGVRVETLAAVSLIPMVEVAWCDGSVSPEERDAVLNAAVSQGIHPGAASYELLQHWLQNRPDVHIIAAWKDYVQELSTIMPKDSPAEMRRHILERCQQVAESAGGFLGLATISRTEQAKIDEFAKAWSS
jgi:hypothetical protein